MRFRPFSALLFALLFGLGALARAAETIDEKRLELLFRPQRGENMTLSPDGKHLAYTEHVGDELIILVQDLDTLAIKARIVADEDRPILHSKEKERVDLRFLRWGAGGRLLFAPSVETIQPPVRDGAIDSEMLAELGAARPAALQPKILAPILGVDADGKNPKQLLDAKDIANVNDDGSVTMHVPLIRGFVAGDRTQLLIEAAGRYGANLFYKLDIRTGKLTEISSETVRGRTVYDWQGRLRLQEVREAGDVATKLFHRGPETRSWQVLQPPAGHPLAASFSRDAESHFRERTILLGFDFDPNVMIVASNVGRDTFGLYGLNLKTWQRTTLLVEHPQRDLAAPGDDLSPRALVFDEHKQTLAGVRAPGVRPFTVWIDGELSALQRRLDERFPQRSVHITEWSDDRDRLLLRVTGGTEPGRIYAYRRSADLAVELTRRTPWLPSASLHATRFFEFEGPGGAQLSGLLTLPTTPRLNPPPMIVWLASGLPPSAHAEFEPQAQVFADMGFVVCRLNQRGVHGLGAKQRDVLRADFEHALAADALAAIEWVAAGHRIDRRRVALYGEGAAAHHAVRAAQQHPEAFRCAVAFQPVFNLAALVEPPPDSDAQPSFQQRVARAFLTGKGARLERLTAGAMLGEPSVPVFIATRDVPRNSVEQGQAAEVALVRAQLRRRGVECTVAGYHDDFTLGLPAARARMYRALEEFINLNLYNYDVKIGPARVIK